VLHCQQRTSNLLQVTDRQLEDLLVQVLEAVVVQSETAFVFHYYYYYYYYYYTVSQKSAHLLNSI